jgi:hypothetical protein
MWLQAAQMQGRTESSVMSEASEARAWARENGIDVNVKGPVSPVILEQWRQAVNNHEPEPDEIEDDETPVVVAAPFVTSTAAGSPTSTPPVSPDVSPGSGTPRRQEIPPQGRKVSFIDRHRPQPSSSSRGKKRARPRVSVENVASFAWGLAGLALRQLPQLTPVGRVMALQADTAGVIIEDTVKGTVVDKVLQPIARLGEGGEKMFGLLGPGLIVGAMCAQPGLAEPLTPVLKAALLTGMRDRSEASRKLHRRAQQMAEEIGEDAADLDELIGMIFAAIPDTPEAA